MTNEGFDTDIKKIEQSWGEQLFIEKIPNTQKIKQIRKGLTELPHIKPECDGITLTQHVSERPEDEDCGMYLLHTQELSLSDILFDGINIPFSEPQAITVYFDSEGNFVHVGIVNENGLILSKWGATGNVYEHKPEFVPECYGDSIVYFRRP